MSPNKFRYDINALRAIAVIAVVLFHYEIPGFAGGFAGVDVFFVISGYLMTQIIIGKIEGGGFSFLDFYKKRMVRIFPALLFMLLVLALICSIIYFPPDYKLSERYAASSVLFVSNILYWRSFNYFGQMAGNNILIHTWSLSVEWQFYLAYPVVLIAVSKLKIRHKYFWALMVATLLLLGLTVYMVKISPVATFYLLPSRAWELFFGGIAFTIPRFVKTQGGLKAMAIAGYLVIAGSMVCLNSGYFWPGALTVIPVMATCLVIIVNCNGFTILKNRVVQLTGKISYSLYLWHWPVWVIFKYMGLNGSNLVTLLMFILSFCLAYLSYTYIERSERFTATKSIFTLTGIVLLLTLGLSMFESNSVFFNKQARYFSGYSSGRYENIKKQFRDGECLFQTRNQDSLTKAFNNNSCLTLDPSKKNILLLGDSHCAELYQSLKEYYGDKGINFLQLTVTGWLPLEQPAEQAKDAQMAGYVFHDFIPHHAQNIDGVILGGNWANASRDLTMLLRKLNNTIRYLNNYHIRSMVIGQTEGYSIPYPLVLAKEYQYHIDTKRKFLDNNAAATNKFMVAALSSVYVEIYNHTIPPISADNRPYMFDENHLTKYGADLAVRKISVNPITVNFFKPKAF